MSITVSGLKKMSPEALDWAGWTTMSTLRSAMEKVFYALEESLAEAKKEHVKVNDDGTCEVAEGHEGETGRDEFGNPALGGSDPSVAAARIELDVKGQIAFASLADTNYKAILDYLAVQTPQSASTADLAVLEYNSEQLDEATALRELALENETFWESATPASPRPASSSRSSAPRPRSAASRCPPPVSAPSWACPAPSCRPAW